MFVLKDYINDCSVLFYSVLNAQSISSCTKGKN